MSINQAGFAAVHSQAPRRWDFLAGLMRSLNLQTFVEVGCKEGRTTGHILKSVPGSVVTAIDPWIAQPEGAGTEDRETYEAWDFAKIEAEFWLWFFGFHEISRHISFQKTSCFVRFFVFFWNFGVSIGEIFQRIIIKQRFYGFQPFYVCQLEFFCLLMMLLLDFR